MRIRGPTQVSYEVFDMLSKQLDEQVAKWKQILGTDVPDRTSCKKTGFQRLFWLKLVEHWNQLLKGKVV